MKRGGLQNSKYVSKIANDSFFFFKEKCVIENLAFQTNFGDWIELENYLRDKAEILNALDNKQVKLNLTKVFYLKIKSLNGRNVKIPCHNS